MQLQFAMSSSKGIANTAELKCKNKSIFFFEKVVVCCANLAQFKNERTACCNRFEQEVLPYKIHELSDADIYLRMRDQSCS